MEAFCTIYLLRHGETAANKENWLQGQSDVPLDENGVKQAVLAGARLREVPFDAVYSSDLSRAMVTARAATGDAKIIPAPELREWFFGRWQGMKLSQIQEQFPREYQTFSRNAPDFRPPEGESNREFQKRVSRFIDDVAQRHLGQQILLVTHGGVLSRFFKHALRISGPLSVRPRTDNTGISVFQYREDGTYQLVCWNDTAHITGDFAPGSW